LTNHKSLIVNRSSQIHPMLTLHYIPFPEGDTAALHAVQTTKCGMKLPRHREGIPAHPDRDAHYWAQDLHDLGDAHQKEHQRHGIAKKRCAECEKHYLEDVAARNVAHAARKASSAMKQPAASEGWTPGRIERLG
jgi:hypothetical protein